MLSVAAAIIVVVVVLTLFFGLLSWLSRRGGSLARGVFGSRDLLRPEASITIHLVDGGILKDARYLGNLPDELSKFSDIPLELRAMILIQLSDGRRSLIRPKSIKSIDFNDPEPNAPSSARTRADS